MNQENRSYWPDYLRVIATLAVIFLHVSATPVQQFGNIAAFDWWVANFYDSCVRFCVPIFVMLTGALLLPKKMDIQDFLKRRLVRVVYPLIFWSIIYIAFTLIEKSLHGESLNLFRYAKYIYTALMRGSSFHLWYIYMIIGIYLFVPIIGKWAREASEFEIRYFLGIWICTLFIDKPFISKVSPEIDLSYFSGYLGYLVLGFYLSTKTFANPRKTKRIALLLLVSGIVLTNLGTYLASEYKSAFVKLFYEYLTPNVFIASAGLFVLFKDLSINNLRFNRMVDFISKYSYGIYLVHVLILYLLMALGIQWDFIHPLLGIPLTTFLCLLISAFVIYLLHKLPFGKYVAG